MVVWSSPSATSDVRQPVRLSTIHRLGPTLVRLSTLCATVFAMEDEAGPSRIPWSPEGTESIDHGGHVHQPQERFSFPPAAQPEIVRAFQKDIYYRDLFTSQLQDVIRSLLGTRTLHSNIESVTLLGSLAYYLLSTSSLNLPLFGGQQRRDRGRGGQTLGEEYVNTIPISSASGRVVTTTRRIGFILLHVLSPWMLTKLYASLRRYAIAHTQRAAQQDQRAAARARALDQTAQPTVPGVQRKTLAWLARNLPALEVLKSTDGWMASLAASHLMLFYLGGTFYSFAQRLTGIRYISTIPKRPGYQPPSYEVLGVLLGVQLAFKLGFAIQGYRNKQTVSSDQDGSSDEKVSGASKVGDVASTVVIDDKIYSHASQPAQFVSNVAADTNQHSDIELLYPHLPEEDDGDDKGSRGTIQGYSVEPDSDSVAIAKLNTSAAQQTSQATLQCTLCMDTRKPHKAGKGGSAVTECGHCFDWDCITAWAREKVRFLPPFSQLLAQTLTRLPPA